MVTSIACSKGILNYISIQPYAKTLHSLKHAILIHFWNVEELGWVKLG